MASHPLRLNFSVVNYFSFIYHKELIHIGMSYISEAVYESNKFHHSKRNHFKIAIKQSDNYVIVKDLKDRTVVGLPAFQNMFHTAHFQYF